MGTDDYSGGASWLVQVLAVVPSGERCANPDCGHEAGEHSDLGCGAELGTAFCSLRCDCVAFVPPALSSSALPDPEPIPDPAAKTQAGICADAAESATAVAEEGADDRLLKVCQRYLLALDALGQAAEEDHANSVSLSHWVHVNTEYAESVAALRAEVREMAATTEEEDDFDPDEALRNYGSVCAENDELLERLSAVEEARDFWHESFDLIFESLSERDAEVVRLTLERDALREAASDYLDAVAHVHARPNDDDAQRGNLIAMNRLLRLLVSPASLGVELPTSVRDRLARMMYEQVNGRPWSLSDEAARQVWRDAVDHAAESWVDVLPQSVTGTQPPATEAERAAAAMHAWDGLDDSDVVPQPPAPPSAYEVHNQEYLDDIKSHYPVTWKLVEACREYAEFPTVEGRRKVREAEAAVNSLPGCGWFEEGSE